MSEFRYNSTILHEWVKAPKIILAAKLNWRIRGSRSHTLREMLQITPAGTPALLEWNVRAGKADDPTTYSASFLVDRVRVRGVDYHPIPRSYFYKQTIPAGWHQDIYDPANGDTQRKPLAIASVTDLQDFTRQVAKLWNIQLPELPSLL